MSSSSGSTTPPLSDFRYRSVPPPLPTRVVKRGRVASAQQAETDPDTDDSPPRLVVGISQELRLAPQDRDTPRNAIIFGMYADTPKPDDLDQPDQQWYEGFLHLQYGDAPVQIPVVISLGLFSTPEQAQTANLFACEYFALKINPLTDLTPQHIAFMQTDEGRRIMARIDGALDYIRDMERRMQPIALETGTKFYVILHNEDGNVEQRGLCNLTNELFLSLYENVYFSPAEQRWYFALEVAENQTSPSIPVLYGRFNSAVEAAQRYYLLAQATFQRKTPLIRNLPISDELMLQMRGLLPVELSDFEMRERERMLAALDKLPLGLYEGISADDPRQFALRDFINLPTQGLIIKPTPKHQPHLRTHTRLGIPGEEKILPGGIGNRPRAPSR